VFLNNNLHLTHHRHPGAAWFELPDLWRRERAAVLRNRSHFVHQRGYLSVIRAHFVRPVGKVVWP
jgi:fatty acid desaturase